jgi:coenzyme PQQ precursor peptide PqqA
MGHKHRRAVISPTPRSTTMSWETPSFEEINMSAEIGSYYEDFDGL